MARRRYPYGHTIGQLVKQFIAAEALAFASGQENAVKHLTNFYKADLTF
jgi:hypothetical protein